jgi:transglutaminase-like putative cysteine protease
MPLSRRSFLKSVGMAAVAAPFATPAFAGPVAFAPRPGAARTFELITRVDIADPRGDMRVWVPVPSRSFGNWFEAGETTFSGNATNAAVRTDSLSGAKFVEATWRASAKPSLEVVSRFATRDRDVDPAHATAAAPLSDAERAAFLAPTKRVPLDGIVKETSDSIVRGKQSDLAKLHAIYTWVVANTYRDAATIGCGDGNVAAMLTSGRLGGKCADINPLFVGLARAAGIPARDLYGIRVAPSRFGYHSLGANSPVVTKAQHCRAEAYIEGVGWMPMDPADVRKVVLEEPPGHLAMTSAKVEAARKTLFGAWETNWMPYNDAQDVRLNGASGGTIPFLMYPQVEVAGKMLDCYTADQVRYTITARQIEI